MNSGSYRDLAVWQKAVDLVISCYHLTEGFPRSESYGLGGQLQLAAVPVAANIAEGQARQHEKEFLQHLSIAYGSLAELETHTEIARRLRYVSEEAAKEILEKTSEVGHMINGLRRSLKEKSSAG